MSFFSNLLYIWIELIEMRQVTAIALLFLYVFTSTEISELLKFPQLVKHYKAHKEEQKDVTFSSFVHQHYTNGDVDDADREQDMKLPYKSIDFTSVLSFTILPSVLSIDCTSTIEFGYNRSPINNYTAVFYSNHFNSIWQPPKIV